MAWCTGTRATQQPDLNAICNGIYSGTAEKQWLLKSMGQRQIGFRCKEVVFL